MPHHRDFSYPALKRQPDYFRLLRISPREHGEDLELSLSSVPLPRSYREYIALSYAWGNGRATRRIRINKHTFWVRENLHRFLWRYSRTIHAPTNLWVDAICIDQSNLQERNHQVGLMSTIYSQAIAVHAWLGSFNSSPALLDFGEYAQTSDIDFDRDICHEAHELLTGSQYFTRLWVIPEVLLGLKVIVCYEVSEREDSRFPRVYYSMKWERWAVLMTKFGLRDRAPTSQGDMVWQTITDHRLDRVDGHPRWTLWDLICSFAEQRCSKPQDRVYALFGLLRERPFPIDYSQSLPLLLLTAAIVNDQLDLVKLREGIEALGLSRDWYLAPRGHRRRYLVVQVGIWTASWSFPGVPLLGTDTDSWWDCFPNSYLVAWLTDRPLAACQTFMPKDNHGLDQNVCTLLHAVQQFVAEVNASASALATIIRRMVLVQGLTHILIPDLLFCFRPHVTDIAIVTGPAISMARWLMALRHVQDCDDTFDYCKVTSSLLRRHLVTKREASQCLQFTQIVARERAWAFLAYPKADVRDVYRATEHLRNRYRSKRQDCADNAARVSDNTETYEERWGDH